MEAKDIAIDDLSRHLIICGWEGLGRVILKELENMPGLWRKGVVVVAETDINIAEEAKLTKTGTFFHLNRDFTNVEALKLAGAERASTAVVLADRGENLRDQDRDARTVLASLTLEKLNPSIFTCAELLNDENSPHLLMAGVEEIISRSRITAGLIASSALNQGVSRLFHDILSHQQGSFIKRIPVPQEHQGKTFAETLPRIKEDFDALIIAIDRPTESGEFESEVNPPLNSILAAGDQLTILIKTSSPLAKLN